MWLIALEAMVALSLLLLIVWATMGGKRPPDEDADEDERPVAPERSPEADREDKR